MLVVVVVGGDAPDGSAAVDLPPDATVIAADSGVDHAHRLGLHVDVAVGDFDSVSPAGLARAEREGARVERHPAEKDRTDLEIALDAALTLAPTDVLVIGGDGGRLDHLLANVLVLTSPSYAGVRVRARLGPASVHVLRGGDEVVLDGRPGDTVTLLSVHGPATGIRTAGLRYPLADEALAPGTSRGVSNVLEEPPARVALRDGVLLAVLPGPEGAS